MNLRSPLSPREAEILAYEDTPIAVIAKLERRSPSTVKNQRAGIARKRSSDLTPTEEQVLYYCACGYSNAEIGRVMFCSVSTVKTHKFHIRAKLGEDGFRRRVYLFPPAAGGQTPAARAPTPPGSTLE